MEKLALGLSLICVLYIVLFFTISYWLVLLEDRHKEQSIFGSWRSFIGNMSSLKKKRDNHQDTFNKAA